MLLRIARVYSVWFAVPKHFLAFFCLLSSRVGELVEWNGGVGQGTRVAKTHAMHFAVPKHFLAFFCLLSSRVGELVEWNGGVG